ncbi:MAG: hypothetical protein HDKAJFGB_00883 [Anaerolineae bacterium]|nr:hypothetical protein [Anaerolineae bacterium]
MEEVARAHISAERELRRQRQEHHRRLVRNAQLIAALLGVGLVGLVHVGQGDLVKDLLKDLALFAGGAGALQLYLGRKVGKADDE